MWKPSFWKRAKTTVTKEYLYFKTLSARITGHSSSVFFLVLSVYASTS